MIDGNDPIFTGFKKLKRFDNNGEEIKPSLFSDEECLGLTKRELFAAIAMNSLIVNDPERPMDILAGDAVFYANSLIEKLNNE